MKMNMVRHKHKILSMKREVQKLFLNEFWFILIMILFIGFFVLEGFDFGVGIVSRFLGKNDQEKRLYMNTIGPYWDANEVWLITAGGAMFAAFYHWYDSKICVFFILFVFLLRLYSIMYMSFYIPLFFMLLALILRGVSIEFRGKVENQKWKNTWDWTLFIGSLLPPILWGVVLANFMTGMPINGEKEM